MSVTVNSTPAANLQTEIFSKFRTIFEIWVRFYNPDKISNAVFPLRKPIFPNVPAFFLF